jgi:hypothetical protein
VTSARISVKGLNELDRAFQKMEGDVRSDFVFELEEAADPARKLATQKIIGEMQNMPRTPFYAGMRIGVTKAATTVYIAPSWRRSPGKGRGRPNLAASEKKRMEAAVDSTAGQIENRIGDMLDRMANEWGD